VTAAETVKLRADRVAWRPVDDEVIALDVDAAVYLSVNRTGAALWPALAVGATRDELAGTLADRYSLSHEAAARDVDSFVEHLSGLGLLEA
jgi:Coenzyme PQQ synthesis protein D (PqqD)